MRGPCRLGGACALALALAVPARAQTRAPGDTIHLGEPADTVRVEAPVERPARDPRWSRPFAVESSGEVEPRPPAREVVWLSADSVHARRRLARAAAAANDSAASAEAAAAEETPIDSLVAETPPPPPRPRRAAADSAAAPRRGSRTASRDSSAAPRRAPARDSAAARARPATARVRSHTVAAGETLFGIARRYGVTAAQLRALNPDAGDELEIGVVLRLPAGARAPATPPASRAPAAATPRTPAAARARRTHVVQAGETLYGLARRYGVGVDAIRAANQLSGDTLRPGQRLTIPAAPAPR